VAGIGAEIFQDSVENPRIGLGKPTRFLMVKSIEPRSERMVFRHEVTAFGPFSGGHHR